MVTVPACVSFQDFLSDTDRCVPLGSIAEEYRPKDYISDLSWDASTLYELHSLPWDVLPSFCYPLSILAYSQQDVLFLEWATSLEEEEVNEGSLPCQRNVRETLSGPNIAMLLSIYTCSWFPSSQNNSRKVTSLLATTDAWADWDHHSLLLAHLWCHIADFENDMLCIHTSVIFSKCWWFYWYPFQGTVHMLWNQALVWLAGFWWKSLTRKPEYTKQIQDKHDHKKMWCIRKLYFPL